MLAGNKADPFARSDRCRSGCKQAVHMRRLCHGDGRATKRGVRADQVSRCCDSV
jgi:hypothetical protein